MRSYSSLLLEESKWWTKNVLLLAALIRFLIKQTALFFQTIKCGFLTLFSKRKSFT